MFSNLNRDSAVQQYIGQLTPSNAGTEVRVITKSDAVAVGIVSVGPSDFLEGEYSEIVCAVLPAYQGRGYAAVACREMLRVAREAGMPAVVGCVDRSNAQGKRLLERLGAKLMQRRGPPRDEQDVYSFA